jgi:uncharacterized protein YjbI with pentapeptide repeats/nucleoid DNA-binding protein
MEKLKKRDIVSVILFLVVLVTFPTLYKVEWSGFGEISNKSVSVEEVVNPRTGKLIKIKKEIENFQSGKTLWDWLVLAGTLAIPFVILRFQSAEKDRDAIRAEIESKEVSENLREESIRGYFDRISNLLVHNEYRTELFFNKDLDDLITDNSIKQVARINTVMVLRRLGNDTDRQNYVLDFLRGAKLANFILANSNLSNINLSKTNFYEICLANSDLTNADLTEAKLFKANLFRANLSKVKLFAADLRAANFSGADFSKAKISKANLSDSNLSNANLSEVDLREIKLSKANLSGANLRGAKLNKANLSGANLSYADLSNANLSGANLIDTNLSGAVLNGVDFTNADLLQANFRDTKSLILEQVKNVAINWDKAEYDIELRN